MNFKNKKEIYEALLAGKKIVSKDVHNSLNYIELRNGDLVFDNGSRASFGFNTPSYWRIYEEPKKKVKRYIYAYKNAAWCVTEHFLKDDEEFRKYFRYITEFMKLENSCIEVDE